MYWKPHLKIGVERPVILIFFLFFNEVWEIIENVHALETDG